MFVKYEWLGNALVFCFSVVFCWYRWTQNLWYFVSI